MNRAQHRAAEKGVPSYKRGRTAAEPLNAMAKNGITAADYIGFAIGRRQMENGLLHADLRGMAQSVPAGRI